MSVGAQRARKQHEDEVGNAADSEALGSLDRGTLESRVTLLANRCAELAAGSPVRSAP